MTNTPVQAYTNKLAPTATKCMSDRQEVNSSPATKNTRQHGAKTAIPPILPNTC